jgi:hypothetical protein
MYVYVYIMCVCFLVQLNQLKGWFHQQQQQLGI